MYDGGSGQCLLLLGGQDILLADDGFKEGEQSNIAMCRALVRLFQGRFCTRRMLAAYPDVCHAGFDPDACHAGVEHTALFAEPGCINRHRQRASYFIIVR